MYLSRLAINTVGCDGSNTFLKKMFIVSIWNLKEARFREVLSNWNALSRIQINNQSYVESVRLRHSLATDLFKQLCSLVIEHGYDIIITALCIA